MNSLKSLSITTERQVIKYLRLVFFSLLVLITSAYIYLGSISKVEVALSSVSDQIETLLNMGATYQAKGLLLSLVEGKAIEGFKLILPDQTVIAGQRKGHLVREGARNFEEMKPLSFDYSGGQLVVPSIFSTKMQLQSGDSVELLIDGKINLFRVFGLVIFLLSLYLVTACVVRRSSRKLIGAVTFPISELHECVASAKTIDDLVGIDSLSAKGLREIKDLEDRLVQVAGSLLKSESDRKNLELKADYVQMVEKVAHDIRSPLAVIKLVFEKLVESGTEKKVLSAAIRRLEAISSDVLESARSSRFDFFSVNDSLRQIIREVEISSVGNKTIEFEITLESGIYLQVSKNDFERAVVNLLRNSIEAVEKAGVIRITGRVEDDSFHLEVSDNGVGLSSEEIEKVLGKGFSLNKEGGNGLGLKQVRRFADIHSVGFCLRSEKGAGTTVGFIFPSTQFKSVVPSEVPPINGLAF